MLPLAKLSCKQKPLAVCRWRAAGISGGVWRQQSRWRQQCRRLGGARPEPVPARCRHCAGGGARPESAAVTAAVRHRHRHRRRSRRWRRRAARGRGRRRARRLRRRRCGRGGWAPLRHEARVTANLGNAVELSLVYWLATQYAACLSRQPSIVSLAPIGFVSRPYAMLHGLRRSAAGLNPRRRAQPAAYAPPGCRYVQGPPRLEVCALFQDSAP